MKKLFQRISTLIALTGLLLIPAAPVMVYAQANPNIDAVCEGVELTGASSCGSGDTTGKQGIEKIIGTVINILSLIVGVLAVVMIIVGGLKYITSSGDSANVASAKNTILYAIVGLIIAALAQIIVRYVLHIVG